MTSRLQQFLLFAIVMVLPTEFGKHFWPNFSFIVGQRVDYLSPTLYISDILISTLFIVSLIMSFPRKRESRSRSRVKPGMTVVGLLGIILFLSLGIFFSQNPMSGWYMLLKLLEFAFFSWTVAKEGKTIFSKLFWTFFLGVFIEGTLGILQFFHQGSLGGLWYFLGERTFSAATPGIANASIHGQLVLRPYGTFSHPNVLAGYFVVALLFFLTNVVSLNKKKLHRNLLLKTEEVQKSKKIFPLLLGEGQGEVILSAAAFVFGCIILFLTLSRVAIAVYMLISFLYLFVSLPRQRVWITIAYCLLPIALFMSSLLSGRFFNISSYSESILQRDLLTQSALTMFISHPFVGVGLGNFLSSLPYYMSTKILFGFLQPVHNIFLLVLSETGIIGLGIFFWLLFLAFRNEIHRLKKYSSNEVRSKSGSSSRSARTISLNEWALLSLIAICLIGMTDHYFLTLQQGQLLFALIVGICLQKAE